MVYGKVQSSNNKLIAEIPPEVAATLGVKPGDDVDFFVMKEKGMVIVSRAAKPETKAEAPKAAEKRKLTDREVGILKRINNIKSWNRTLAVINKELTRYEKAIFDYLLKNKVIFAYKKEGKELYGISKEYLEYVIGKALPEKKKEETKKEEGPERDPLLSKLEKEGFLILENEGQAKELNLRLKSEKREGSVKGIRGFDKKYYVITADKLADLEKRLPKVIGKGRPLKEIAAELKLSEGLCKAAIELMREDGKVIEKRRDVYALA